MKPCVIGIAGRHRTGKDTFKQYLLDAMRVYGCKYSISTFGVADGMKQDLAELFGTTVEAVDRIKLTNTGRRILEYCGDTIYGRESFLDFISGVVGHTTSISIITGIRRPEEGAIIRRNGGYVIKLERQSNNPILPTEGQVDEIAADIIVENNSSLLDLYHAAHNIAPQIICTYQLVPKI